MILGKKTEIHPGDNLSGKPDATSTSGNNKSALARLLLTLSAPDRLDRRIEWAVFLALFIAAASFFHQVEYDNTSSRYYLVSSVVDLNTLNIDSYHQWTIDKSFHDGHYYSNKAIGAPMLGIPVYWFLRNATPLRNAGPLSPLTRYLIRLITTTILFSLLGIVLFRLARRLGTKHSQALYMVLGYGLGTPALLHAAQFSGHQITASFAFLSFALIARARRSKDTNETGYYAPLLLAGMSAGLATVTEFPALVIAGILTVYVFLGAFSLRQIIIFCAGGVVFGILLASYNYVCFGSPLNLAYANLSLPEFSDEAASGLFGVHMPRPSVMMKLLFSPARGILLISPVLLLAVSGIWRMAKTPGLRLEAGIIISICISYLLFYSGYVGWHGGWSFGSRYLVPMLPFTAFPIVFANFRPVTWISLFTLSAAQIWLALIAVPHIPESIVNPLVETVIPCLAAGYASLNAGVLFGSTSPLWALLTILSVACISVAAIRWSHPAAGRHADEIAEPSLASLAYAVCAILVVATLATSRTGSLHTKYAAISRLLNDAARITHNEQLAQGAHRYALLAEQQAESHLPD